MKKQRITSIDVFRGLTMMLMVLVNNPGSWENIYPPLEHAEWHGWTPTDLVFPFFVFIMGVALAFSRGENHELTRSQFTKITGRSLRLIALGVFTAFYYRVPMGGLEGPALMVARLVLIAIVGYLLLADFEDKTKLYIAAAILLVMLGLGISGIKRFETLRFPGVLQRLGVVYFFAAIIFLKLSRKNQIILGAVILIAYWLIMAFVPVPGTGVTGFEKGANIAGWLDEVILRKHVWAQSRPWDPEGILSTFPAIVTCLLGVWMGEMMKAGEPVDKQIVTGVLLLAGGWIWGTFFPINKALWTSSYVLLTAGLAVLLLVLFGFIFNNQEKQGPVSSFLTMWGVNPIFIFFGSGILPGLLNLIKIGDKGMLDAFYTGWLSPMFSNPMNASLAFAIANVVFWTLVLIFLKKRNIIIKV